MKTSRFDKRKTYPVAFTKVELMHLRDLFSVMLPPEMERSVSESLAEQTKRPNVEAKLWQKLAKACVAAKIPLDEDAPDFVIGVRSVPSMDVYQIAHDPEGE